MTPQQFQRVKSLFAELDGVPADERRRALDARSGDDPVVRAEVARLLEPDDAADQRLDDVTRHIDHVLSPARVGAGAGEDAAADGVGRAVGPYRIVDVLGRGGMGVVYLAHDTRLGRKAALKAVLPGLDHDGSLLERLRREARVLASFSHPNLATVYGLEESGDTFFIALEFIEGRTLSRHLGRNALPIPEALALCEQIACGLEAAPRARGHPPRP